jgi:uncharacterized protein with HEPN domain
VKSDRLYLLHIREAIEWIEEFTSAGEMEFFKDRKTQDAVLRNLHTLSESTQHLSEKLKVQHPEIEWRTIAALRNVVVHDYLGVDLDRIWDIIEDDLPSLKKEIVVILEETET